MKIFSDENSGKSFLDITPKGKKNQSNITNYITILTGKETITKTKRHSCEREKIF